MAGAPAPAARLGPTGSARGTTRRGGGGATAGERGGAFTWRGDSGDTRCSAGCGACAGRLSAGASAGSRGSRRASMGRGASAGLGRPPPRVSTRPWATMDAPTAQRSPLSLKPASNGQSGSGLSKSWSRQGFWCSTGTHCDIGITRQGVTPHGRRPLCHRRPKATLNPIKTPSGLHDEGPVRAECYMLTPRCAAPTRPTRAAGFRRHPGAGHCGAPDEGQAGNSQTPPRSRWRRAAAPCPRPTPQARAGPTGRRRRRPPAG